MILEDFQLQGKVAIVTGCNTGLGQAMALALAQAGATVIGVNRSPPHETAEQIQSFGGKFYNIEANLSQKGVHKVIIEKALRLTDHLDILVNNAGIIRRSDSLDFTEDDWDEVMNVNSKTVFFLSQAFAKQCIKQNTRGKIIHIASMLSFQGGIRVPSYTASKTSILGLTRIMANEWASKGINVNAIAPGYMVTNNTKALREDKDRSQAINARIPAGEWGKPADLMGTVVFLSSKASDYVHAAVIPVDGGWLAR
ncbi:MAG: 2-dehydro-3-deoxy-D-gluconate 5-dehydrogenase KduD [Treponemataceae bacterium]